MQNGGFVNKIQGVRLSVAKIHRHVFENPGPNRSVPAITLFGRRTLQVYFWHYFVITILDKLEVNDLLMATTGGRLIWILSAVFLAVVLSLKPFAFPTKNILKACKSCND